MRGVYVRARFPECVCGARETISRCPRVQAVHQAVRPHQGVQGLQPGERPVRAADRRHGQEDRQRHLGARSAQAVQTVRPRPGVQPGERPVREADRCHRKEDRRVKINLLFFRGAWTGPAKRHTTRSVLRKRAPESHHHGVARRCAVHVARPGARQCCARRSVRRGAPARTARTAHTARAACAARTTRTARAAVAVGLCVSVVLALLSPDPRGPRGRPAAGGVRRPT